MGKETFQKNIHIRNKRASFEYTFIDTYVAGVVLSGTEIKSIRQQKVQLQDAFCTFFEKELWIRGMDISLYSHGTHYNHEPKRDRKLLLSKRELRKLKENMEEKGLTIVPTRLFVTDKGIAKIEIALAKGKKLHDKRDGIKERDVKREMDRERDY